MAAMFNLDLVLEMNPDLSVYESHAITERVENFYMSSLMFMILISMSSQQLSRR